MNLFINIFRDFFLAPCEKLDESVQVPFLLENLTLLTSIQS